MDSRVCTNPAHVALVGRSIWLTSVIADTAVINRMPLDPAVQDTPVRILALLQEMREHGHQPDAMLYVTLIRALSVHASHTDTALVRLLLWIATQIGTAATSARDAREGL